MRLPGRVDPGETSFASAADLTTALDARPPHTASMRSERASRMQTGRSGTPRTWSLKERASHCRMSNDYDVIVIGGGSPGEHCAGTLAEGVCAWPLSSASCWRRVLLLRVHSIEDASAAGRGRARLRTTRQQQPALTQKRRSRGATTWFRTTPMRARSAISRTTHRLCIRGRGRLAGTGVVEVERRSSHSEAHRGSDGLRSVHSAGAGIARARGHLDESRSHGHEGRSASLLDSWRRWRRGCGDGAGGPPARRRSRCR